MAPCPVHAASVRAEVCVLVSPDGKRKGKYTERAIAALELLGNRATRVDVQSSTDPTSLASQCGRVAIAIGRVAIDRAQKGLPELPMVVVGVPGSERLTTSRPKTYGVATDPDPGATFGTLLQLVPSAKRVGVVYNPGTTGSLVKLGEHVAKSHGLELVALPVSSTADAVSAFGRFQKKTAIDALWIVPDRVTTTRETAPYAMKLAAWKRIPVIGPTRKYVSIGALYALTLRRSDEGRLAASIAEQLLRGETPRGFHYASDYAVSVGQHAADRLGVRIPREILKEGEVIR